MFQESSTQHQVAEKSNSSTHSTSDKSIVTAAQGGAILFAGELFSYVFGFLFSVVIARFLGAGQFGLYQLSLTTITIVGAVCYLGLDGGLSRFIPIAVKERREHRLWGIIQLGVGIPFLLSLILALVFILMAEQLSNELFQKPSLTPVLRIFCFAIPLTVLAGGLSSVVQGFKKVKYDAYSMSMAFQVIKLLGSVALLVMGMGVMGVAISYAAAIAVAMVMLLFFVNRIFSLKRPFKSAKRNTREMFRFSLPLYFARLLNRFSRNLETLVLGVLGVLADVGVYSAILRLSNIGVMGLNALQRISEPIISELHSQGNTEELRRLYQTTTKWSLTFNLPIFLTVVLFADNLLSIFGNDFTVGAAGFIILSAGILFKAGTGFCGTVVNMTGHTKLGLYNSIIYVATAIILDIVLISRWQLVGAALAGTLTIILINILRTTQVFFIIKGLLPFNKSFFKPIAAAVLSGSLTFGLSGAFPMDSPLLELITLTPILWIVYATVIFLLKLSEEDRMILNKLLSKVKLRK